MTAFAFDFPYFEHIVLPYLRGVDIRNINVLVDGDLLAENLEQSIGNEFDTQKSYSISPIVATGVFHPKIMLLTGHRHGLLVIGSGNITASGISSNDEIWGAFHLDAPDSPNAAIFAAVWEYLSSFFSQVKGSNRQKISWISQYAKWIQELPVPQTGFLSSEDQMIRFIGSQQENSIYQSLIESLPNQSPERITIVSPYFDKEGQVISQLHADLKPKEICCILEKDYGQVPSTFDRTSYSDTQFYYWEDCVKAEKLKSDQKYRISRLHAKMFHFEYAVGEEYLYMGSANASIQALGSSVNKGKNAEAGLLLKREAEETYLQDLGIFIPIGKEIGDFEPRSNDSALESDSPRNTLPYRIIHSEIDTDQLEVHLKAPISDQNVSLVIQSRLNSVLETVKIVAGQSSFVVSLHQPKEAFMVFLQDQEGKRVSNYSLIHQTSILLKSNPDPNQEKINSLLGKEKLEETELGELLNYIEFNWIDEDYSRRGKGSTGQSRAFRQKGDAEVSVAAQLSEEEFDQEKDLLSGDSTIVLDNSSRIAEFLSIHGKNFFQESGETVTESSEQLALEEKDRGGGDEEVESDFRFISGGKILNSAIQNYFRKLSQDYQKRLKEVAKNKEAATGLNLVSVSNYLIALHLIYLFYGKKYKEVEKRLYINEEHSNTKSVLPRLKKNYDLRPDWEVNDKLGRRGRHYYAVPQDQYNELISEMGEETEGWYKQYPEEDRDLIKEWKYIEAGKHFEKDNNTLMGLLVTIIGPFLHLAKSGFKEYEDAKMQKRFLEYQKTAMEKTLFIILKVFCSGSDIALRDALVIDVLHYIAPKDWEYGLAEKLEKSILSLGEQSNDSISDHAFRQNFDLLFTHLLPQYLEWVDKYNDVKNKRRFELAKEKTKISEGTIVFKKDFGFCAYCQPDYQKASEVGFGLKKLAFLSNSKYDQGVCWDQSQTLKMLTFPA